MHNGLVALLTGSLLPLSLLACKDAPEPAASAAQCYVPERLELPTAATPPDRIPDPPATGHVLALSWSPEFCRFRQDAPEHRGQCQDNRFGFILHGLWPQTAGTANPRACAIAPPISEALVRAHYCMTPSADLMQHEWSAHGTCGWESAETYYAESARLWDRFRRPDLYGLSRKPELTAADVRAAFAAANADLPAEAVGIDANTRGWLQEVLICLTLDYEPRTCRSNEAGEPDESALSIWRGG